ncbi:acyltransferase family protein [Marinilactibacillus kalidii]|uniref:acyltransferase family protein n=1 Tax=Marinilactibacillus kalidii TaxID=2820274 RepID=UPI001ABE715D|nr:acyltransferase [Marinilactibacillus kalidii]
MIKPLQSLRFIAIFFVFLSHLLFFENTTYEYFFLRFLYGGYWGVTFFLVLSGFVMSYNYQESFKDLNRKKYLEFIKKRLIRLFPIHIFTFILAVPFYILAIINYPIKYFFKALLNILLIQSLIPIREVYFSFNSVSWYLSCCFILYLLTPLLLFLLSKIMKSNKYLIIYGFLIYLIAFLAVIIWKEHRHFTWIFYISPFFRIFDFSLGLLLGIFIKVNKFEKSRKYYTIIEISSVVFFIAMYLCYPYINKAYTYGVYYLPIMLLIVAIFSINRGYISKLLENKRLVALGGVSFEFYVIHKLIIDYLVFSSPNINPILIALISFIMSILSAIILNRIFKNQMFNKFIRFN